MAAASSHTAAYPEHCTLHSPPLSLSSASIHAPHTHPSHPTGTTFQVRDLAPECEVTGSGPEQRLQALVERLAQIVDKPDDHKVDSVVGVRVH